MTTETQNLIANFPEINPANYLDDEVNALNSWGIAAHTALETLSAQVEQLQTERVVGEAVAVVDSSDSGGISWTPAGLELIDGQELFATPQPPAQPAQQPMTDDFLQPNDYRLLHRFIETTEDDESYDITKAEIKRLADLGVVQSHGFGKYSVTMFGYWVHERYWEQNPSLPLKTNADRDAEAAHGIKGDV